MQIRNRKDCFTFKCAIGGQVIDERQIIANWKLISDETNQKFVTFDFPYNLVKDRWIFTKEDLSEKLALQFGIRFGDVIFTISPALSYESDIRNITVKIPLVLVKEFFALPEKKVGKENGSALVQNSLIQSRTKSKEIQLEAMEMLLTSGLFVY